ncbi:MAG: type III-A CRISPR-associated RAMP protein Csm4 [Chloroflexi bacterium]|nr:MAG: type III-A CRISPR-associated RAMP protein Csm4 [Chloroflexota bacterium]
MSFYAVYLRPRCALSRPIGSDTLFGAMCWAVRELWGTSKLEDLLKREPPPFAFSSAFPCLWGGNGPVRFYPRPATLELTVESMERLSRGDKKRKVELTKFVKMLKVPYFSEEVFSKAISGELDAEGIVAGLEDRSLVGVGEALLTRKEAVGVDPRGRYRAFWRTADVQRNQVDRMMGGTAEGMLFFSEGTAFSEFAGLWFLVSTDEPGLVEAGLRYLEDTGFGGERSVGWGHYEVKFVEERFRVPEAEEPDSWVNLSRYIPKEGECDFCSEPLAYELLVVRPKNEAKVPAGGYRLYKGVMRVFAPGSVFPLGEAKLVYGRLVPSGSSGGWKIFHSGLAIPAFSRFGGEG